MHICGSCCACQSRYLFMLVPIFTWALISQHTKYKHTHCHNAHFLHRLSSWNSLKIRISRRSIKFTWHSNHWIPARRANFDRKHKIITNTIKLPAKSKSISFRPLPFRCAMSFVCVRRNVCHMCFLRMLTMLHGTATIDYHIAIANFLTILISIKLQRFMI